MSQTPWTYSHSGTAQAPFSFIEETTFGVMPTSPSLTAVKVIDQVTPTIDNMEMDVRTIGSHYLYGMQSGGHTYGLSMTVHPFDLPFLQYGTNAPNYTSPAGTSARSVAFAIKYMQSLGTVGQTLHNIKWLGCRPNTTEISISSQGVVEASMEWIPREMTIPAAGDIAGASWPSFPTSPVLSNVDGGNKPLTIDGTDYAVEDFRISWNNNLIQKTYSGSGKLDGSAIGAVEITGSFNTPVGQDLSLETDINTFPQAGVDADYNVKSGVMVIDMANFKLMTDSLAGVSAGPQDIMQHEYTFKCSTATLGTSA